VIIFISHIRITRLVSRPIRELSHDIAELPERIANDSLIGRAEVTREDEIGDLQKAFHNMAVELYEKNHALHMSNADLANANRELESFSYSVSHDLRAPLRNIDGFSKILMDDFSEALPDKAKHYLQRVRNGTNRMSMLIDDILAFSRIGRTDIEFKKMPCSAIVNSVLENLSEEIAQRNVAVTVGDLPVINCGPTLMQSLFLNLISNALKFTRNTEKPEITIGFDKMRRLIFVRDNGLGFDMKYHDKIFQIFQRLYLPEEFEGTGIGLSIVKRIAERHHGKVWAESEPGRGATFFIDLPTF
jgi:light-regulated signal transduction histidine kinase (bacteriophytochrome)